MVAALIGAGIGAGLGYGPLLHYKSEGVLAMDLTPVEYKRITELADAPTTLQQALQVIPLRGLDVAQMKRLETNVATGRWHMPIPKVNNDEMKSMPAELLQARSDIAPGMRALYLGVRFNYSAHDPSQAALVANWLGDYLKDAAAHEALRGLVSAWAAESRQFADQATAQRLQYNFAINQAQLRAKALKTVVAAYPQAGRRESQQVVDVRQDNAKYMTPLSQLVGAESEVIDLDDKLRQLNRRVEQETFARPLIADAQTALGKAKSGSDALQRVSALFKKFAGTGKTDAEQEKLAAMATQIEGIGARFLTQARVVAEPPVPSRPERPSPHMAIVLCALLAAFLGAAVVWRDLLKAMLWEDDRDEPRMQRMEKPA